jgi:hypothetical protein
MEKFRKQKSEEASECVKVKAALPSGGITKIVELTGYDQQLVQRTLKGQIKRWDKRHSRVMREARKLIQKVAL